MPNYLDRVRRGDWVEYDLTLRVGDAKPTRLALKITVVMTDAGRCRLRVARRPLEAPAAETVTSYSQLTRRGTWLDVWKESLKETRIDVKTVTAEATKASLKVSGKAVACRKLALDYQGSYRAGGRPIAVKGKSVYWLNRSFPIQGIMRSESELSYDGDSGPVTVKVVMTHKRSGHTPPKEEKK